MVRADGTKSAKIIQVIETRSKRGMGTEKDPVRDITQYWDLDGNFLAEMDLELLPMQIEYESKIVMASVKGTAAAISEK